MNERLIDPRAWLLWAAAASLPALVGRNPEPLLAALLATLGVHASWRGDTAMGWHGVFRLGMLFALAGVLFNVLTAHLGDRVLARLPDAWPVIGGVLTLNALVYGVLGGIAVLTLLLVGMTLAETLDWATLLRLAPERLALAALTSSIAWGMVPQIARAWQDLREARLARGIPARPGRDLLPALVPLLANSLERALTLGEAMEARGFGAPPGTDDHPGRGQQWVLLVGLMLGVSGAYALALGRVWFAIVAMLLAAVGIWWGLRTAPAPTRIRRTRYRQPVWDRRASVVGGSGAIVLLVEIVLLVLAPWSFAYEPYPMLTPPAVNVLLAVALGGLLAPAFVD